MQITELLDTGCIALGLPCTDKTAAIHEMVGLLSHTQALSDAGAFEADVLAREAKTSTDVGGGIAIPHAKSAAVLRPALAAVTLREGYEGVMHGEKIRLLFLIAAPEHADDAHIQVLSRLAMLLMDPDFAAALRDADTPEAFLQSIAKREEAENARAAARKENRSTSYRLLAVTACPTGIAHTYMAAEALEEAARKLDVTLKVETNGATGVDNLLSAAEIAAASCVIVAADKAVDLDRFAGKPLLRVPVTAAVRCPEELVRQALSGEAPRYTPGGDDLPVPPLPHSGILPDRFRQNPTLTALRERLRHGYVHLMNGVSHMLPFVTGGGILIALAYLLDNLGTNKNLTWMMRSVGNVIFELMYPVLSGFIALSMAGESALAAGVLGGWLAQTGMTVQPELYWISSGFWGALVAGFGAGLLIRLLKWLAKLLPKQLDQAKSTLLLPVLSVGLMGGLMVFCVNPPLGEFNNTIYRMLNDMSGGSRLLLCSVLGGLMATDYGGPINKAAYLFGTLALMNDQYDIMAAVMIGGMTPPIGVAMACMLFPERFTEQERRTAPQNLLLGASFVTEGALPFALRDPLRVIPSTCLGSMAAGMMSSRFGCMCPAPHGGLFLLPVIDHPWLFLLSLLTGGAVTALALGILKKPLRSNGEAPAQNQTTAGAVPEQPEA